MRNTFLLALTAVACACGSDDDEARITRDAPAGPCSVGATAQPSITGLSTYAQLFARVPSAGPSAAGTRGLTLTCLTPGAGGTLVTLMLPMLRVGSTAPAGAYHVQRPGEGILDERTAWAEAQLTVSAPARYVASGGSVHIVAERDGVLEGSYQLALLRAPETDPRYPEQHVLWGAFRTPLAVPADSVQR